MAAGSTRQAISLWKRREEEAAYQATPDSHGELEEARPVKARQLKGGKLEGRENPS